MTAAPPIRRPLSAGSEIDAWCTRCKMELGHRIVAMVAQAPKRVLCMTCGSEHNYRAPKATAEVPRAPRRTASSSSSAKSSSASSQTRATNSRVEWERRVRSGGVFRRYSITDTFSVGDLISHKKFGEGYVVSLIGEGKVTIAFVDGERTLVHGATE